MDPDPDPLVRDTDPRIRIRTKMSRIPNTPILYCKKFNPRSVKTGVSLTINCKTVYDVMLLHFQCSTLFTGNEYSILRIFLIFLQAYGNHCVQCTYINPLIPSEY